MQEYTLLVATTKPTLSYRRGRSGLKCSRISLELQSLRFKPLLRYRFHVETLTKSAPDSVSYLTVLLTVPLSS